MSRALFLGRNALKTLQMNPLGVGELIHKAIKLGFIERAVDVVSGFRIFVKLITRSAKGNRKVNGFQADNGGDGIEKEKGILPRSNWQWIVRGLPRSMAPKQQWWVRSEFPYIPAGRG